MRADHVPSRRELPHLGPRDEFRRVEVVCRDEEVPAPPRALQQIRDVGVRARAAVVKGQEDRGRTDGVLEHVAHGAAPRGDCRHGRQVPLEVVEIELVARGGATGKATGVPVAPPDDVMI